jgi:hypothetical protein
MSEATGRFSKLFAAPNGQENYRVSDSDEPLSRLARLHPADSGFAIGVNEGNT